jgi:undecaprenyl-diphosphatase
VSLGLLDAVILGVVEGLTEFLPVSSTGHLTITEGLLGLDVDDPSVTAFTAVIQSGAILAVLIFFAKDIARFARGFFAGVRSAAGRQTADWRFTLAVVLGSLPIGVVGLLFRDVIKGPVLRSLTTVGIALIAWSAVMVLAERRATQERGEAQVTIRDGLLIGIAQCVALVPGVSRSGATISAGLLLGIDRVTATRMSFFLAIPALTAAGALELPSALDGSVGAAPVIVGTVVSFIVAYASIAFLLRFVARNSIVAFVPYRVALGVVVLGVLAFT